MKTRRVVIMMMFLAVVLSVAGNAVAESFKIAVLPDTQLYSKDYPAIFTQQTNWIVTNMTTQKIAFVTHLGDLVQSPDDPDQWENADDAMDILDGQLPYSVCLGNHDYDIISDKKNPDGATIYQSYFGASRYSGYSWYKGDSQRGLSHYQIFTAGGRQWLHLNLEIEPDLSILMWAQDIIDANPTLPVIISTHAYLSLNDPADPSSTGLRAETYGEAANGGYNMWHKFVSHNDQIIMTLNGHYAIENHLTLQNVYGHDVFMLSMDYQGRANGGDGWMNLVEFDSDNDAINVKTYSPKLNQSETDPNSQYSFAVDFDTRFSNFSAREVFTGIQAANLVVEPNSPDPNDTAVIVSIPTGQKTTDFNLGVISSSNRGDYFIQVGSTDEDDTMGGILINSVAEHSRTIDGYPGYYTPAANLWSRGQMSVGVSVTSRVLGDPNVAGDEGGYEGDVNVASAYFPFSQGFLGAHCQLLDLEEGDLVKVFSAAGKGVVLGENFTQYPNSIEEPNLIIPKAAGDGDNWSQTDTDRGLFELTLPDVNSMTDGVILANAGGNEDNFVNVSPYPDGSGWQISIKDNGAASGNTECDAFSFVYVPYATPGIVAGRVSGNSDVINGNGGFYVERLSAGVHRLRIYDHTPADGALLLTGENHWSKDEEYQTFQPDFVENCWTIENRDLPESDLSETSNAQYVFVFAAFDGQSVEVPFEGSGTPEDPYKIYTQAQLEAVGYWSTAHYILMNDINLTGTTYDAAVIYALAGSFDGNDKTISNLTITAGVQNYVGLFGEISEGGQVFDLTVDNAAITTGGAYAGALAGECDGAITNCHTTGSVTVTVGSTYSYAGGLVGYLYEGSVDNCHSTCTIQGFGRIGGLVGQAYNNSTISNSYATGNVSGTSYVGGLVGRHNNGCVTTNCYAAGTVTGTGNLTGGLLGMLGGTGGTISGCHATGAVTGLTNTGGLVGQNEHGITNCYATGAVTGTGDYTGGLVGHSLTANAGISGCHATGAVSGVNYVGGLAGQNENEITNCYANTGTVSGNKWVGGLVGLNYDSLTAGAITVSITDSNAGGNVTGVISVGGLIGESLKATITNCFATGDVTGTGTGYYVGGFVGYNNTASNVSGSYAEGAVSQTGTGEATGGFAGSHKGVLENCHASGSVTSSGRYVGGFAGHNAANTATISDCYSTGNVTMTGTAIRIGGFVGRNIGVITTSYATGDTIGYREVGGFAGVSFQESIINCYATGAVTGTDTVSGYVGGFIGRGGDPGDVFRNCYATGLVTGNINVGGFIGALNDLVNPTVFDCFWDTQTTGMASSAAGTPKNTAEMKTQSTFTNWDFTTPVWYIRQTVSYPKLKVLESSFADADLDLDGEVDIVDLRYLAGQWLQTGTGLLADIAPNNKVDLGDFAVMASQWMAQ